MANFTIQDLVSIVYNNSDLIKRYVKTYGEQEFINAVTTNNLEMVKLLLEHGVTVDCNDNYGINEASERGYLEMVKYLVEKGANVHTSDDYPLRWACINNHIEVAKFLIEKGAHVTARGNYAIQSSTNNFEIMKLLVENGADIRANNNYVIKYAIRNGNLEMVKFLIEKGVKIEEEYLISAISNHHLVIAEFLVSKGVTVTSDTNHCSAVKNFLKRQQNTYYGIVSDNKIEIKLPELEEISKNNKYYYVYKCIQDENGIIVPEGKNTILSQFGKMRIFNDLQ